MRLRRNQIWSRTRRIASQPNRDCIVARRPPDVNIQTVLLTPIQFACHPDLRRNFLESVARLIPEATESDVLWTQMATPSPQTASIVIADPIVATVSPQLLAHGHAPEKLSTLSRVFFSESLTEVLTGISWSHHKEIIGAASDPSERYFYMQMSARERWSVRELRRQIESGLFLRYMSVSQNPEKCLPTVAERGDLLPFKDHYILEFLGLTEERSERELRKAILANLREFFLEFGRDLTFVGEEYPLTVGNDTFRIDLLFFHRRLQCLLSVELKIGDFLPEYVGKSLFYVAALDEQIRLPHEQPSIGLVLCRNADHAQVRLALSPAAKKVGVATWGKGIAYRVESRAEPKAFLLINQRKRVPVSEDGRADPLFAPSKVLHSLTASCVNRQSLLR